MDSCKRNPPGILFIRRIRGKEWSLTTYRYVVLLVTFISYTAYHASRKPTSTVKSVFDPDPHANLIHPWPVGDLFLEESLNVTTENNGWYPFNGVDGTSKLGEIDVAFLACYSIGMYVAGHLGDKLDLRIFLSIGMIGNVIFVGLFGMGYFWNVHIFMFYLAMQMVAGLFQATGLPSVVAVIGNWFGKRKRGLIMGIWNAHTSIGNITGSLLAAGVLQYGWGWSFILPGAFIFLGEIMMYMFLPAYPEDVGFYPEVNDEEAQKILNSKLGNGENVSFQGISGRRRSVGLLEACLIPGVIPFALCLFFANLVAYTFLYWLIFLLKQLGGSYFLGKAIGGKYMSVKSAGNLSTLFDVGGIVGGILAGYISDKLKARATAAATFMYFSIPAMILYRKYGSISRITNIMLMMVAGLFVNGPYALITTAVSADLGTHSSLRGDPRALATVAAIIDGTGSIGAALGPLMTGFLSSKGWDAVFSMLVVGAFAAGLLLSHLIMIEIKDKFARQPSYRHNPTAPASRPLLSNE